jgi:hypothetical protein
VKLSVKFLAALAVIAVAVVAYAGSQQIASAAVTGTVHLTNKWSTLTTESSAPSGRTFIGSGNTLYATMEDMTADGLTNQNTIVTNSDVLVATVIDADANVAVDKTVAGVNPVLTSVGAVTVVVVPLADSPIVDRNGDGLVNSGDVTIVPASGAVVASDVAVSIADPGSETTSAIINLVSTTSADPAGTVDVVFKSSAIDDFLVAVYSTVEPKASGIMLRVRETGRSTGRFEGEIKLIDNEVTAATSQSATATGSVQTATLRVQDGNTVSTEYTDTTPATGSSATVTQTARVELSAPVPVITAPVNEAATQVQRPAFAGSVTDTGSGLDVDLTRLYIDLGNDAANADPVIDNATSVGIRTLPLAGAAVDSSGVVVVTLTGTPSDGATNIAWTHAPGADIPTGVGSPDHTVDYQAVAVDRAGNIGFSDADGTTAGAGSGDDDHEPNTVKIDRVFPDMSAGLTGNYWDAADKTTKANRNTSIEVQFNDEVTGIDPTDFQVTLDNNVTLVPVTAEVFSDKPMSAFLTLGSALGSAETPNITVVNQVSDKAGNTTSSDSLLNITDKLAPVITVGLSGGTGTGTGATGPTGLTRTTMVIEITSDEALSGSPTVQIFAEDDAVTAEGSVTAIAQGGNVWRATFNGAGFSDAASEDKKSVFVSVTDVSTSPNTRTAGNKDDAGSGAITFTLDKTAPALVTTDVTKSERRPFVLFDFTDNSTVTPTVAMVGDDNVLTDLATTDNKRFFYVPPSDLDLGDLTITGRATDVAGNIGAQDEYTLTIEERAAFNLQLFAGWNAVSVPSDPIDPDINTVLSNEGIDQAVAYDATNAASPWRIATKDEASGNWSSSTTNPLNTIMAGWGYWVHNNNFEGQEMDLQGPAGATSDSPPPVVTIPTGAGWNFVGVVDQSREQTTGDSTDPGTASVDLERPAVGGPVAVDREDYFSSVNESRVYRYDPTSQTFLELSASNALGIGEGLWVFIVADANGDTPDIVP